MSGPAWSNVPAALVSDPTISATAKLVALAMGVHTNASFTATLSKSRIAETAGISLSRAKRGTRELIDNGWLTVKQTRTGKGTHDVNRYQWNYRQAGLAIERMAKGRAIRPVPTKPRGGRVTSDPRGRVSRDPKGRVTSDPHTNSFNTIGETSRSDAVSGPESIGEVLGPDSDWAKVKNGLKPRGKDVQTG